MSLYLIHDTLALVAHVRIDKNMFLGETPPPKISLSNPCLFNNWGACLLGVYRKCLLAELFLMYQ